MKHLFRFYLRQFLSRRETWVWVVVMPILFSLFFGVIFKKREAGPVRPGTLHVVNLDNGPVAQALLDDLDQFGYRLETDPAAAVDARLTIPEGFSEGFMTGDAPDVQVRFFDDSGKAKAMQLKMFLAHFMVRAVRTVVTLQQTQHHPARSDFLSTYHRPATVTLDVTTGDRKVIPAGFDNSFPANMVMFLILNVLIYGGIMLRLDLDSGITHRILVSPVGKFRYLVTAILFRTSVGICQALILLVFGYLAFHVRFLVATPWLIPLVALFSLSIATLSMLLATVVHRLEKVTFAALLVTLPLAALGGCWWPLEIMPPFWQRVAWFLPTGNLMSVFNRIFIGPVTVADLWPYFLYSATLTVVMGALALTALNRKLT